MSRLARGVLPVLAIAVWTAAIACSSKMTPHPPTSGDCTGGPEAGCSPVVGGGGGGGLPLRDGGTTPVDAGTVVADGEACGTAATLIPTANLECQPCVAANCCMVDEACTQSAHCIDILTCTEQQCTAGGLCVNQCEMSWPDAVTVYDDFAMCVTSLCPSCPAIPVSSPNDP